MNELRMSGALAVCIAILMNPQARSDENMLELSEGQKISTFKVEYVYENESGMKIGARFRHTPSNFVLDLLRIQSVPQAFLWVNSFPPSDMGEPHTCEHLMLGKGTKGRYVGSLEEMYLGNSSAFTAQLQTCYHFHTAAGTDAFYALLDAKLDALIHPDFTDEEIRREVCNVGYTIDPIDSTIRLEEKGTVYNEMISSFERPWGNLGRELGYLLYGTNHPLSNESGGYPDNIREMIPEDMRRFISKNYHLSNMGMVLAIGDEIELNDCLERVAKILQRIEPDAKPGIDPATADQFLPEPKSAPYGTTRIVGFPSRNDKEPGLLLFAWPPVLEYDNNEGFVLELFMGNLASGETSNLFRKFIDSQTREMNVGANAVFEWISSDEGHPIYIGFNNIKQEICNEAVIDTVRQQILMEIRRIIELPDNSPELLAFNEKARNKVIEKRRDLRNFLNTPPGFGFRGTSGRWYDHLKHMQNQSGFIRKLTLDDELGYADELLSTGRNFWRDFVRKWLLLDNVPYAVAAGPDTNMLQETENARKERIASFTDNLKIKYNAREEDEAIKSFKKDYDSKTAQIESRAAEISMPKFVDNPPLTLDDQLQYEVSVLPGGQQMVASTFKNMTSAMAGLAFRMDVIPESLLVYTAVLPTLLTEVGVTKDRRYSYDEMKEAIRREILELRAYHRVNYRTERAELVVRSEGGSLEESKKALEWMESVLFEPDWSLENLPRMRDAVDLALSDLRNTMRAPEEAWVNDPALAYWKQLNPLLLSANSFLTQTFAFQRTRWLLRDIDPKPSAEPLSRFIRSLAQLGSTSTREQLTGLLLALQSNQDNEETNMSVYHEILLQYQALPDEARKIVSDIAEDLKQNLAEIPDSSLEADWRYLCNQIFADLLVSPQQALSDLRHVMSLMLRSDNARAFMVSNAENRKKLLPDLEGILGKLSTMPSEYQSYGNKPIVISRLRERIPSTETPVYVGLINDNTRGGVIINSAPCASFEDSDPDVLLKFLAARLYGGGGAHSMFMKTWGAGLAYSNGLRSNEFTGRLVYYAERCPDLAQTMQFVVNELRTAPRVPSLAEYAVAQAFSVYRSGSRYEYRGEAQAADLADGLTPDKVKRFRKAVLELRKDPDLYQKLDSLMEETYGLVLPGYGPSADQVEDAVNFIIGPESQFRSYEDYLHSVEGNFTVYRLYPRDFWLVQPESSTIHEPQ